MPYQQKNWTIWKGRQTIVRDTIVLKIYKTKWKGKRRDLMYGSTFSSTKTAKILLPVWTICLLNQVFHPWAKNHGYRCGFTLESLLLLSDSTYISQKPRIPQHQSEQSPPLIKFSILEPKTMDTAVGSLWRACFFYQILHISARNHGYLGLILNSLPSWLNSGSLNVWVVDVTLIHNYVGYTCRLRCTRSSRNKYRYYKRLKYHQLSVLSSLRCPSHCWTTLQRKCTTVPWKISETKTSLYCKGATYFCPTVHWTDRRKFLSVYKVKEI
jgi:hypothetical protein